MKDLKKLTRRKAMRVGLMVGLISALVWGTVIFLVIMRLRNGAWIIK